MVPGMSERKRPYIGATSIRLIAAAAAGIGLAWGVGSVAYAINGATRAGAPVVVPGVRIVGDLGVNFGAPPFDPPGLPPGSQFSTSGYDWLLAAPDSTVAEQLFARSGYAVAGLGLLIGTFLLRGLLLSVADGRPFDPRNARRLAGIALVVLVTGLLGPALPDVAGVLALDRLGGAGPDSPYRAGVDWEVGGAWFVWPVLLALAEAFRRGAELADDVRGLV